MINQFLTRVPRPFNMEETVFSINGIETTGQSHAKDELTRSAVAQHATGISGEITPERMKRQTQSKSNTQLCM